MDQEAIIRYITETFTGLEVQRPTDGRYTAVWLERPHCSVAGGWAKACLKCQAGFVRVNT
jgi:hypothetical protein